MKSTINTILFCVTFSTHAFRLIIGKILHRITQNFQTQQHTSLLI